MYWTLDFLPIYGEKGTTDIQVLKEWKSGQMELLLSVAHNIMKSVTIAYEKSKFNMFKFKIKF